MGFFGDLEDFPLQDILYVLSSHGKSGRLTLSVPSHEITLVFQRGRVASVTSTDANLRIGRLLIDQGYVTEEQMDQALALQDVSPHYERIGDVLVDLEFVNHRQIARAVAAQFEASLFHILIQPGGTFAFASEEADAEPAETMIEEIPIEVVVLNALRRADEYLATHAADLAIELSDEPVDPEVLDALSPEARGVLLAVLNGAGTSYALGTKTGLSPDELLDVIAELSDLGLIVRPRTLHPVAPLG